MNPFLDIIAVADPNLNPDFLIKSGNTPDVEEGGESFDLILAQNMMAGPGMLLSDGILNEVINPNMTVILDTDNIQETNFQMPPMEKSLKTDSELLNVNNLLIGKEVAELLVAGKSGKAVVELEFPNVSKVESDKFSQNLFGNSKVNNTEIKTDMIKNFNPNIEFIDNRQIKDINADEIIPQKEKQVIDDKFQKLAHLVNLKNIEINSDNKTVNIPSLNPVVENRIRTFSAAVPPISGPDNQAVNLLTGAPTENTSPVNYNSIEERILMEGGKKESVELTGDKLNVTEKIFDKILESVPNNAGAGNNKVGFISLGQTEQGLTYKEENNIQPVRFIIPNNIKTDHLNGKQTITIKLIPEQLGTVRLTLSSYNNTISGKMIVESASAMVSVESNLNHLVDELAHRGIKLDSFDISLAGDQSGRQFAQSRNSESMKYNNRRLANNRIYESDLAEDAPRAVSRNYFGGGGVNLVA
ncbi:MAG: flagellar hook-length control protein FliK [Candidatus Zixiibacteriota bacterium]